MKRRALWIICATVLVLLCVVVTAIAVLHREEVLDRVQEEALEEIEANRGEYDEKSIVLYGTDPGRAKALAKKLGAELRITNDGRFATLTLCDERTVADIYADEGYREYLQEFSLDYEVRISGWEEKEDAHHKHHPNRPQTAVSDADFSKQTYFDYLNMGAVWNRTTGSGITVAVIDTGIDTDHPEFSGRISSYSYNATEDKIVKDYTVEGGGYDWSLVEDTVGHGTAVSGVIAASKGSGNIIGVAPSVTLLVIKAECDENGVFKRSSDLVFGLYYAIERDVSVVNMSFGTSSDIFEEATRLAYDSDVICVAATGNDGSTALTYPAADPYVFGVGALNADSWELASYSNYGENVDLVAPGTTYTALMGGAYGYQNGTSLAAPTVTGALALYLSQNKYATFDAVEEVLYASCYDLGDLGADWYYGYGALDVNALVLEEKGTVTFDMMSEELENTEQLFVRNHTLQNLPSPERLYAVFDGWYYDPQCTEEFVWYEDAFSADLTLYAAWANEDDGLPFTWVELEDGTVEIRSYTGRRRFITVPAMIEDKPVSSIGEEAFKGETSLREVILPDTLKRIRRSAFEGCANLVHIEIPDGVTEIGAYAFSENLRLSYVAFGENSQLKSIGGSAFAYCSKLTSFTLPKNLTSMDGSAFLGATSMTSFAVAKGNSSFRVKDGVLFNSTMSTLISYPAGLQGAYTLPASVRSIGICAFGYTKLTEVTLDGVQGIGDSAFTYARLESVSLPDSVTALGEFAFYNNAALASVRLSERLQKIPSNAFAFCTSLASVEIPASVQTLDESAFLATSSMRTVTFAGESRLASIGGGAFMGSGVREIEIPAAVVSIGTSAFEFSALSSLTFREGSNLRVIADSAFAGVPTQTVTFPASLEMIGEKAFMNSSLTTVTLPERLSSLGDGAFAACAALTEIKVEEGNSAFKSLGGVLYSFDESVLLACPAGNSRTSYSLASSTARIEDYAFYGCAKIKSYTLPATLEEIGTYAFSKNTSLTSIRIPDSVIQIGRCAFAEDMKLTSVTFGESSKLPRIGYGAFAYCGITSFRVPANVSTMGQGVFVGCTNLTAVTFAANSKLESISAYMFDGCSNLTALKFENGSALTSIQAHGLEGMRKLTSIDFGDAKLENIDNFAFRFCESLTRFDIPEGVTYLGRYAFYDCLSLSEVTVPASMEYIGAFAFLGSEDCNVYFASETLPAYLAEDWDHGTKGYYLGVTDVITDGDWTYATLTNGGIAILKYSGTETDIDLSALDFGGAIVNIGGESFAYGTVERIVLPDTLVTVQNEAFYHSALQSISIPASVEFIGNSAFADTPMTALSFSEDAKLSVIEASAFEGTKSLASVTLPKSLTTLGRAAFKNSGISAVTFEEGIGLREIFKEAFAYTKLASVSLPDTVSCIWDGAFRGTKQLETVSFGDAEDLMIRSNAFYASGLTSLSIPANVTYIGEYAFVALENLTAFEVASENPNYQSVDGLLLSRDGRKLITVPAGLAGTLEVPQSVEVLGFGAFEESALTRVTFSADTNLLTVGCRAFFGADIEEMEIPASVVSIDYYAFAYCEDLTKVSFADENLLRGIYEGAFFGCKNLSEITLPDTVKEISDFAFYGCAKLKNLPITEASEVQGIYDYAFAHTGLSGEFTTPATLLDIGAYAFQGNNFTSVTVPDANARELIIGIGAFEACNEITEITLPFLGASFEDPEITWFGYIFGAGGYEANSTYVPATLKHVNITADISFIGTGGFYNLSHLESIDLPHSVTLLEPSAFGGTSAKYELTNTVTVVSGYWIGGIPNYAINSSHFGRGISGHLELSDSVTDIGFQSFYRCRYLTGISVPDGVKSIGISAFEGCTSLECITLPEGVTSIASEVFSACSSLKSITIPDSVTSIGAYAFQSCSSLESITIPDGVTSIGDSAFSGCSSLKSLVIPDGVTSIGWASTFYACTSLTSITIPDGVTRIGNSAFGKCTSLTSITIPNSVKSIGNGAFGNCTSLTSITIPENVTSMGFSVFNRCDSLEKVEFAENSKLATMGDAVFRRCTSLTEISIPNGVEVLNRETFADCTKLSKVTLGNSLREIGALAFFKCTSLKELSIPDTVTNIGGSAFSNCSALMEVTLPKGLLAIGGSAFTDCGLLIEIIIPENVTSIGSNAFSRCSSLRVIYNNSSIPLTVGSTENGELAYYAKMIVDSDGNKSYQSNCMSTADGFLFEKKNGEYQLIQYFGGEESVTFPADIEGNPYSIYEMRGVKNVILPEGMTSIGKNAFNGCRTLEKITISNGVTSIGSAAFSECRSLKTVTLPTGVTRISNDAFFGCISLTNINLPNTLTHIGYDAFVACVSLSELILPDSLTAISSNAFKGCTSLKSIAIPDGITVLGDYVFYKCTALETVSFSENSQLASIGRWTFMDCTSLKTVAIPAGVKTIGADAFRNCTSLVRVTLPKDMTSIDSSAFVGCDKLQLDLSEESSSFVLIGGVMYDKDVTAIKFLVEAREEFFIPKTVTDISSAFKNQATLKKVTFEQGSVLKSIGSSAFEGCTSLTSIAIPDGVECIDASAFSGCTSLTSITIPKSVTSIGNSAFSGCTSLTSIMLPDSVTNIGDAAFYGCSSLTSITVPDGVTSIGNSAFSGCTSLTSITLPDSVTSIGWASTFYACTSLTSITIPDSVTSICSFAFYGCSSLTSITIPDGVTSIENSAFRGCSSLTSITIPDGVTSIGNSAFYGCTSLRNITIPDGVTSIRGYTFYNCSSLTSITIPDGVTSIESCAFSGCKLLTSITIPDGVTSIGSSAFNGCGSLTSITIPERVTSIGSSAFNACGSLASISVLEGNGVYCSKDGILFLKDTYSIVHVPAGISGEIILPAGMTSIDVAAFSGCHSLTSIVIPNGVKSIAASSFRYCNSLTSIVIPDSVESIGNYAFEGCASLKEITIPSGVTNIGIYSFYGCTSLASIKIPNGVTSIGERAFCGCTALKGITLPNSITSIGRDAFEGCTSLIGITIPDSVTSIGNSAFSDCASLKEVTILSGVTGIGERIFMECTSLEGVTIPDSVESIGNYAFYGCTALKSITIPNSVISIGNSAFYRCTSLKSVTIPESVTSIGTSAFNGGTALKSVTIPGSVESIAESTFKGCTSLTEITLAEGITGIGNSAFEECGDLMTVTIPSSVTSIGNSAFYRCSALYVVYNQSTLPLSLGSSEYGCLAYYARMIVDKEGNEIYRAGIDSLEYIVTEDKFCFLRENGSYKLIAYCGEAENVTLPESIFGETYAIYEMRGVKHVIIPEGITVIGDYAFYFCETLISVKIPQSVTSIGNAAFYGCTSLKHIEFSENSTLAVIGSSAFSGCSSLVNIKLPDSVTDIPYAAFANCTSLESISIPDAVKAIGSEAFKNTAYYNDPANWKNGILYIGNHLIKVLEDTVYYSAKEAIGAIAPEAFDECYSLKELTIAGNCSEGLSDLTNLETLIITQMPTHAIYRYFGSSASSVPITLKNIVLGPGVKMHTTAFKDLTGVTVFVTDTEKDTQWDANYPDWNNGNRVIYGGDWSRVRFYDADGTILSSTYYQYAQVIRRPALSLPEAEEGYTWMLGGWDLDGDGEADTVPATATEHLDIHPILQKTEIFYDVIFYAEDGKTELMHVQLPQGALITPPSVPAKKGYTVNGWTGYTDGMTVSENHIFVLDRTHDGDGHVYADAVTVPPTCTEKGYDKHICTVCDEWYADNYTDAGEHALTQTEASPSCTENGYILFTCTVCGYRKTEQIDAVGHSYAGTVVSESTCDSHGVIRFVCTVCGDETEETLPLASHRYEKHKVSKSWIQLLIECILDLVFGYEGDEAYCYRCSVCGEYMRTKDTQASGTASVMGTCIHTPGEWTVLIVGDCENDGVEARICTLCHEVVEARESSDASGHAYPAGKDKCTACGHFRDGIASLYGYSLSLNGNIALNFYIEATAETMADPDAYLLLTMPDGSETRTPLCEVRTKTGNGVTYYVVNPELPAKEIDSIVTVQIVRGDGREGIVYERSIRQYADAILENSSSYSKKLVSLLEQMVYYGEVASKYFGGETCETEMAEITAQTLSAYAIRKGGSFESGLSYYGSSVLLESETRIRHYFLLKSGSIEDHSFTVDGAAVTPVREGSSSYWYIDIPNVASKDLERTYTVCVDGFTLEYSALSYAYAVLEKYFESNPTLSNVARALYLYNVAANAYYN